MGHWSSWRCTEVDYAVDVDGACVIIGASIVSDSVCGGGFVVSDDVS